MFFNIAYNRNLWISQIKLMDSGNFSTSVLTKIDKSFHAYNSEHINHVRNNNKKIEGEF